MNIENLKDYLAGAQGAQTAALARVEAARDGLESAKIAVGDDESIDTIEAWRAAKEEVELSMLSVEAARREIAELERNIDEAEIAEALATIEREMSRASRADLFFRMDPFITTLATTLPEDASDSDIGAHAVAVVGAKRGIQQLLAEHIGAGAAVERACQRAQKPSPKIRTVKMNDVNAMIKIVALDNTHPTDKEATYFSLQAIFYAEIGAQPGSLGTRGVWYDVDLNCGTNRTPASRIEAARAAVVDGIYSRSGNSSTRMFAALLGVITTESAAQ